MIVPQAGNRRLRKQHADMVQPFPPQTLVAVDSFGSSVERCIAEDPPPGSNHDIQDKIDGNNPA